MESGHEWKAVTNGKQFRWKVAIVVRAAKVSIHMTIAAAVNCQLIRRDSVFTTMGFNDEAALRARSAPFLSSHLMGPDASGFPAHVSQMKKEEVIHGGSTFHFKTPDSRAPKTIAYPRSGTDSALLRMLCHRLPLLVSTFPTGLIQTAIFKDTEAVARIPWSGAWRPRTCLLRRVTFQARLTLSRSQTELCLLIHFSYTQSTRRDSSLPFEDGRLCKVVHSVRGRDDQYRLQG